MCRLVVVATIASCYYCVSQWMMHGVHAQQQDTSTLAYPQRNRFTYNKDTSIRMDAQALDEIWEREAALAQAEAERLLMGDYNNDMSIVPTPAPVRLPTMAPSIICTENTKEEYLVGVLGSITPEVTLLDPTTPQGQAFEFVLDNDPCNYPVIDARYALASLFYSTNGTQWVNSEGWLTEASECDWFGVSCNDGVFTTNITLPENNLKGTLPAEITSISTLTRLELFSNELSGPIPSNIGNLKELQVLDLEENKFSGPLIPTELLQLTGLVNLFLSNNMFTGSIPAEINQLTQLESFWAAGNDLTGLVPNALGDLDSITTLILYNNLLTNRLEDAPFTRMTNLQNLQLWGNNFEGTIPPEIAELTRLNVLRLDYNFVSGSIPAEIGTMTALTDLRLSNNLISGTVPNSLAGLSQLKYLVLGTNFLTGQIPDIFSTLPELVTIDLSFASLSGTIPRSIFSVPTVEMIYLNNNVLSGSIPASYVTPLVLSELFLNNNQLTGTIPAIDFAQLLFLNEFTLQFNLLTGTMPRTICDLRDPTVGVLEDLQADCTGEPPEIVCDFPSCCSKCFDSSNSAAGAARRRGMELWIQNATLV